MERKVEQRQPAQTSVASPVPAHLWVLDPAIDDQASRLGPRTRPYSFWAECECPDECLRDHANE
jgi:hypothetical protein